MKIKIPVIYKIKFKNLLSVSLFLFISIIYNDGIQASIFFVNFLKRTLMFLGWIFHTSTFICLLIFSNWIYISRTFLVQLHWTFFVDFSAGEHNIT